MNVLFLSFSYIVDDYERIMHVDAARVKEYYSLFREKYKNVDYYRIDKEGILNDKNNVTVDEIDVKNYDFVFIYHEEALERILKHRKNDFIFSIPTFIQIDCNIWECTKDPKTMSLFSAVGIAHPHAYHEIVHKNKYLIPNATINRNFYINSENNGNIVYIGRVKNVASKLAHFSNITKKNINLYTFDSDSTYAEKLNNEKYINYMGCVEYSKLDEALLGCSYGLCFFDNESPCGKIFDYLSYGLPVLAEMKIGEAKIISDDNLGVLFDFDNLNELSFLNNVFSNENIFKIIQEKHLWKNRLDVWFKIINNIIDK